MFTDYPDVLTTSDSCEILRISRKTLYNLIHKNKIKAVKVSRCYRIPKCELLRYLNES